MSAKRDYKDCLASMYDLRRFGIKLGLDTIRSILEGLGSPHTTYKSVHIAGTNGKGSIASTLATILTTAGYRVGLYTSPHLVQFNERIQIDNHPISNREVVSAYRDIVNVHGGHREPTFFEFATAMAFHVFARKQVDWAIIETGMGGRLDATNILCPELSIITNISLEHREYLGDTIFDIATEKAGIIKPGIPVVTGVAQSAAMNALRQKAGQERAPLLQAGKSFRTRKWADGTFSYYGRRETWRRLQTGLVGRHQINNASLVLAACENLIERGADLCETDIRAGLLNNCWPGRLEVVRQSPLVILDGAHNLAAAKNLARYLSHELGRQDVTLVVGILNDKPYRAILKSLAPVCRRIILTRPETERGLDPEVLYKACLDICPDVVVTPTVPRALALALQEVSTSDIICVAGSLYVVGEAHHFLSTFPKNETG